MVKHHAVQVLVLSVEAHLNVTSELWVVPRPVCFLDLVTQQAGHALHLHLLLSDKNLKPAHALPSICQQYYICEDLLTERIDAQPMSCKNDSTWQE